ncbi:MAG: type VI secretion system lipoprotein TssJ [Kangiella sp.]|jgi:type VI secretion system protein VasD|nr:type VI secretion system lipoprotein TssJ [Kangiella sp.]
MKILNGLQNLVLMVVVAVALSGCSLLKGGKGEEVELRINVDEQVNPDELGRSSPIVLRLYELKKEVATDGLDFFSVYDQTGSEFEAAVSSMKEFQVNPGQAIVQTILTDVSTKHLMIVAAFKDIDNSQWKVMHDLEESDELTIAIEGKTIIKQ